MTTIDTSGIDSAVPAVGNAYTANVRNNFAEIINQLNNAGSDIDGKINLDATLQGIAGTNPTTDELLYTTGTNIFAKTGITDTGRQIIGPLSHPWEPGTGAIEMHTRATFYENPIGSVGITNNVYETSDGPAYISNNPAIKISLAADGNLHFFSAPGGEVADSLVSMDRNMYIGVDGGIFIDRVGTYLKEQAAAGASYSSWGHIWVKDSTPNELYFTDEAGTDFLISGGAGLWTPVAGGAYYDNYISVGKNSFNNYSAVPSIIQLGGQVVHSATQAASGSGFYDILQNAYYDGTSFTYKRINAGSASHVHQSFGSCSLRTAPTGAAGSDITWNYAFSVWDNGTVSGSCILNESNMASASSNHLATQSSIKDYVDNSLIWTATTNDIYWAGAGAVGIGTADIEDWGATVAGLQIGDKTVVGDFTGNTFIGNNAYNSSGAWYYRTASDRASRLTLIGGELVFVTAPAGTIDTEVTGFIPGLHVDYEAKVSVGTNYVRDWGASGLSVLRVGYNGSLASTTADGLGASLQLSNGYFSNAGTDTYNTSDEASQYEQVNGTHAFRVAGAGTVSNPITWTSALSIANSGVTTIHQSLVAEGPFYFKERAAAVPDVAGYGQIWVKDDAPNTLWFTDDTGVDVQLGVGGGSSVWTTVGNDIYYNSGGVSIGNASAMDWDSITYDVLKLGVVSNLVGASTSLYMLQNAYYNAGWKFQGANKAARLQMSNGNFIVSVSSNTGVSAGDAITSFNNSLYVSNVGDVRVESGVLKIKEAAAAGADTASFGQIWVKNDAPNTLWFTDDTGVDYQLGAGGGGAAAWGSITGTLSAQTDLQTALDGKSPTTHNHAGVYEPVFTKNTGFNKNFGSSAGTVSEGNHTHTGVYEPVFSKNTGFNKNFGTAAGTVSEGNHTHSIYAPLASPALTGTPTAPTQTAGNNTTRLATTAFVTTAVAAAAAGPLSINSQTGTTYTLVIGDAQNYVSMNNAAANTLTIPTNVSVAFPVGTEIVVQQIGTGTTTIAGPGVTLQSTGGLLDLTTRYSAVTLIKKATNTWTVIGDLA